MAFLSEQIKKAERIVDELVAIAALQCLNCGKTYTNTLETHKPRWWRFGRPECRYRPAGEEKP